MKQYNYKLPERETPLTIDLNGNPQVVANLLAAGNMERLEAQKTATRAQTEMLAELVDKFGGAADCDKAWEQGEKAGYAEGWKDGSEAGYRNGLDVIEPMLTIPQAAALLGHNRFWINNRTKTGKVNVIRIAGCQFISKSEVERLRGEQ